MKFGVRLPQDGPFASKNNLETAAKRVESLGFDSIWVHDNILWKAEDRYHVSAGTKESVEQSNSNPIFYEALLSLAHVAGVTDNILLGNAAIVLPLRNPVILGKQLATLYELSGGRLVTALCIGAEIPSTRSSFNAVGVSYKDRGKITDEYLQVLRSILKGEETHVTGKYVNFNGEEFLRDFNPKPIDYQLWYAARPRDFSRVDGPSSLRRAVQYCDGWLAGMNYTVSAFEVALKRLRDLASTHNRDLSRFTIGLETFACLEASDEIAKAVTLETRRARHIEDLSWTFIGSNTEVNARLEAYKKIGVEFFEIKLMAHSFEKYLDVMDRFAREILPSWI